MVPSHTDVLVSDAGSALLEKGETVLVTGASTHRGQLVVKKNNHTFHLPHQMLDSLLIENE